MKQRRKKAGRSKEEKRRKCMKEEMKEGKEIKAGLLDS